MMAPLLTAALLLTAPKALRVEGARLTYGGRPVVFRGVCVGDVLLARGTERTGDYQAIARDWKANCVRIGVAPVSWRTDPAATLAALRADVDAALKARMFVIVDWHAISWPDGYTQLSDGKKDLYDGDFTLATSFWQACAKAYGTDGRVAFQLWCEPVFNEEDWKTPPGAAWKDLKPFFQRLTDTIRAEGAGNLLLASGNQWAYDLRGIRQDPLPDPNTAYEWHVYAGHDDNDPARWAAALDDLDRTKPVVVTEWGYQADTEDHFKGTAETFGKPFLDLMESRGMSWTAWCWHPTWGPTMLERDWTTPTDFGRFAKDALAAKSKHAVRP